MVAALKKRLRKAKPVKIKRIKSNSVKNLQQAKFFSKKLLSHNSLIFVLVLS